MISKPETQVDSRFQIKGKEKLIQGSILQPQGSDLKLVLNFINLKGTTDGPLYTVFDKRWSSVRGSVKSASANRTNTYKLGYITHTAVQSDVWVVNLLCQGEDLEVDEKGLQLCLKEVCKLAKYERASVCVSTRLAELCPASLATMLTDELASQGVGVSMYLEPGDVLQIKASPLEELTNPVPVGSKAKPKAKGKIKRSDA